LTCSIPPSLPSQAQEPAGDLEHALDLDLDFKNNSTVSAADPKFFINMISKKRSIRDARRPPTLTYQSPPLILGGGPVAQIENREGGGSEDSEMGEPVKKDRALQYLDETFGYPASHVVLPNLDLGRLANFHPLETTFNMTWELPPQDTQKFKEIQKNLQTVEDNVKFLCEERITIGTQLGGVDHRLDQLKNFAAFVIQWQQKFASETKGLADGTVSSIRQLTQNLEDIGQALNGLQNVVAQNFDTARGDSENIHHTIGGVQQKIENLAQDIDSLGTATLDTVTQLRQEFVNNQNLATQQVAEISDFVKRNVEEQNSAIGTIRTQLETLGEDLYGFFENMEEWKIYVEGEHQFNRGMHSQHVHANQDLARRLAVLEGTWAGVPPPVWGPNTQQAYEEEGEYTQEEDVTEGEVLAPVVPNWKAKFTSIFTSPISHTQSPLASSSNSNPPIFIPISSQNPPRPEPPIAVDNFSLPQKMSPPSQKKSRMFCPQKIPFCLRKKMFLPPSARRLSQFQ
jgi:hypothetical protein